MNKTNRNIYNKLDKIYDLFKFVIKNSINVDIKKIFKKSFIIYCLHNKFFEKGISDFICYDFFYKNPSYFYNTKKKLPYCLNIYYIPKKSLNSFRNRLQVELNNLLLTLKFMNVDIKEVFTKFGEFSNSDILFREIDNEVFLTIYKSQELNIYGKYFAFLDSVNFNNFDKNFFIKFIEKYFFDLKYFHNFSLLSKLVEAVELESLNFSIFKTQRFFLYYYFMCYFLITKGNISQYYSSHNKSRVKKKYVPLINKIFNSIANTFFNIDNICYEYVFNLKI